MNPTMSYRGITIPAPEPVKESQRGGTVVTCQWCGAYDRIIPGLTVNADNRCDVCQAEWESLAATGLTGRQMTNRWEKRKAARRSETLERIAAAKVERTQEAA